MIIETTMHTGKYAFVKVPDVAYNFRVDGLFLCMQLREAGCELNEFYDDDRLPPGNWIIVGIGKDLPKEEYEKIIDWRKFKDHKVYKDYQAESNKEEWFMASDFSFESWLRSHGADENYLILKEVK